MALFEREAEDFRVSDQVIGVPVASTPINKGAHLVQHGGGNEPAFVLGRERMDPAQLGEKLSCQASNFLRPFEVYPVLLAHGKDGVTTFSLDLPARNGGLVVVGQHLGQQPVPQPQGRISKTGKVATLHEFRKDVSAGHDDLRPARSDSGHLIAALQVQLGQASGKAYDRGA